MHQNITSERFYDGFSHFYAQLPEKKTCEDNIKHFEKMLELLGRKEGLRYIELGCGSGRLAEYIIKNHREKFAVLVLVDICATMVDLTAKRVNSLFTEGDNFTRKVKVVKSDVESLEWVRGSHFDIVVASCVVHLVENPFQVMEEVKRYMKPDGLVLISFSSALSENHFNNVFNRIMRKYIPDINNRSKCFEFAEKNKFGKICEEIGFEVVDKTVDLAIYNDSKQDILDMYIYYCEVNNYRNKFGEEKYAEIIDHIRLSVDEILRGGTKIVYPADSYILKSIPN